MTPVIDPETQILYACSWTSPDDMGARGRHYLEAISLVSWSRVRQPLDLEGAEYDPGDVPVQKFASIARRQRAALLFAPQFGRAGTVFVTFSSISETVLMNRVWIIAVDVAKWRVTAAWCSAENIAGGTIWQAGSGLAIDKSGFLYAMTCNGDFHDKLNLSESYLKFKYTPPDPALRGVIELVDDFTPVLDTA